MRDHDVPVALSLELRFFYQQPLLHPGAVSANYSLDISEKKWLDLLNSIGYKAGWIVEIGRPEVEDWGNVVSFLNKALERLNMRDAEGAIGQCRAAWKSLDPILKDKWTDIAFEIDRGSTGEEGYDSKSKRVGNIKKYVAELSNTGDHPEAYAANLEDAYLVYRMTSSLVAYLSRKQVEAERHSS